MILLLKYNYLIKKKIEHNIIKYYNKSFIILLLQNILSLSFFYSNYKTISLNIESFKNLIYLKVLLKCNSIVRKNNYLKNFFILNYNNNIYENLNNNLNFNKFNKLMLFYSNINPIGINLYTISKLKIKSNWKNLNHLIGIRNYISNLKGYVNIIPLMKTFSKGMEFYEYLISSYGARKGILDTALKTSEAGYIARKLIESSSDINIKEYNCNSFIKIKFNVYINSKGFLNNFYYKYLKYKLLYKFLLNKKKYIFINLQNSNNIFYYFKKNYINFYFKNSLTCNSIKYICAKCYGIYKFNFINMGYNIGNLASQSISEPITQMTLKTFHTSGSFLKKFSYKKKLFKIYKKYKIKINYIIYPFMFNNKYIIYKLRYFKMKYFININFKYNKIFKYNTNIIDKYIYYINFNYFKKINYFNNKIINKYNIVNDINFIYNNVYSELLLYKSEIIIFKNFNLKWKYKNLKNNFFLYNKGEVYKINRYNSVFYVNLNIIYYNKNYIYIYNILNYINKFMFNYLKLNFLKNYLYII